MQYTDLNDLPEQFTDRTAGFNKMQQQWYADLLQGAKVVPELVKESASYRAVIEVFQKQEGHASKSRETFLALQRAQQEFYRACAAEHVGRYRASQAVVDAAVLLVMSTDGETQPRPALLQAGVPADEVGRISGKNGARRKVKKALQKHASHEKAQRMIQSEGKREYMRLAADTLSGSLEGIAVNMKTQARLARLEQKEAEHEQRIRELEARLALIDTRHAVEDTGIDPKAEAKRMRAEGMSIGAIATALGRGKSTIQRWV